jgi:hypothetical protein
MMILSGVMALPGFSQTRNESPEAVGLKVLIPDSVAFRKDVDNNSNWEPEATALGDGTLLLIANTFQASGGDSEVSWVLAVNPDGTVDEYPAFQGDDGTPYTSNMDTIRTDGNPPKIAGDLRDGSTKYVVANESTPFEFSPFNTDSRWQNIYTSHIFAEDGPQKITNVMDPVHGGQSGLMVDKIRTGGVAFLSNGNVLVGAEDRSGLGSSERVPQVIILDSDTGATLKGPFHAIGDGTPQSFWEGLTGYNGGFAVRVGEATEKMITFYDNAGNRLGHWAQINPPNPTGEAIDFENNPEGYTTSIDSTNRGDQVEMESNIHSNYIYYAGHGPDDLGTPGKWVYCTKIDTTTMQSVNEVVVNDRPNQPHGFDNQAQALRVFMAVDENDNVFVGWSDDSNIGAPQIIGRFFDSNLVPVTESFLVFQASDTGLDNDIYPVPLITYRGAAAMRGNRLLVSARTEGVILPNEDTELPKNSSVYTVIEPPYQTSTLEDWFMY